MDIRSEVAVHHLQLISKIIWLSSAMLYPWDGSKLLRRCGGVWRGWHGRRQGLSTMDLEAKYISKRTNI